MKIKIKLNLFFAVAVTLLNISSFAQEQLEIRKQLKPLYSSRADVEKIGKFVRNYSDSVRYETDKEYIDVYYSQGECAGHGWNIPADRILKFISYPKKDLLIEDVIKANKNLVKLNDDVMTFYFINQSEGITYVVSTNNLEIVEYLMFVPLPSDSDLRCKGFPAYNLVSNSYATLDSFTIKNIATWDVGLVYNTLHRVKETPDLKGYIFIYCKKGLKSQCNVLQKKIEKFVFDVSKMNPAKVNVKFGGYRNSVEVETFVIEKDNPPPLARPSVPK